jgi:hypothetical protein
MPNVDLPFRIGSASAMSQRHKRREGGKDMGVAYDLIQMTGTAPSSRVAYSHVARVLHTMIAS